MIFKYTKGEFSCYIEIDDNLTVKVYGLEHPIDMSNSLIEKCIDEAEEMAFTKWEEKKYGYYGI